jgi:acetylornithine deacetylase
MGPGDSARSHTADEFIYLDEIQDGIDGYINFIKSYAELLKNKS